MNSPAPSLDAKNSIGAPCQAVMDCIPHLNEMQRQHPDWFDEYEDAMVDVVADRAVIESLLERAPNEFLRGMMYGKLVMRIQIALLTERAF